jgi:hypothetical protein
VTIQRSTIQGSGDGTVDTTGWAYAVITPSRDIQIEYTEGGKTIRSVRYAADGEKQRLPTGRVVKIYSSSTWRVDMQSSVPAVNLSELKISIGEDGKYSFSGDDDVIFRGQDGEAAADISGIPLKLDDLAKLFQRALSERSIDDPTGAKIAAKYCKLKSAFIAKYSA